jgi:hypothetical protein
VLTVYICESARYLLTIWRRRHPLGLQRRMQRPFLLRPMSIKVAGLHIGLWRTGCLGHATPLGAFHLTPFNNHRFPFVWVVVTAFHQLPITPSLPASPDPAISLNVTISSSCCPPYRIAVQQCDNSLRQFAITASVMRKNNARAISSMMARVAEIGRAGSFQSEV